MHQAQKKIIEIAQLDDKSRTIKLGESTISNLVPPKEGSRIPKDVLVFGDAITSRSGVTLESELPVTIKFEGDFIRLISNHGASSTLGCFNMNEVSFG